MSSASFNTATRAHNTHTIQWQVAVLERASSIPKIDCYLISAPEVAADPYNYQPGSHSWPCSQVQAGVRCGRAKKKGLLK